MADLHPDFNQKNTFWRRWGALFILAAFFVASWAGQFATQLATVKQEAETHQQQFVMQDFWPEFFSSTFENWQSEWLQLFTQGLLLAGFATTLFRKQDEEHYKTQLMIEDLRTQLTGTRPSASDKNRKA